MLIPAPELTPYHRLARTAAHRWWRPLVGTLFVVAAGAAVTLAVVLAVAVPAAIVGLPDGADGFPTLGARGDLAFLFLTVAALLPVPLLAAEWFQRRPAGTLSSVAGRLRWRWLATCLPVAAAAVVLFLGGGLALAAATGEETGLGDPLAGLVPFLLSMLVLLLVVPPQAAAEEYVTRGWLLQAVGSWCRGPWVPIAVQALVFAALHGWGTPWGFAELLVFGAVAGWLTVRTGGLEAAIALHVLNNLLAGLLGAAYNDLGVDETAADMPWQFAVISIPVVLGYAAVIVALARRRGLATRTPENSLAVGGGPLVQFSSAAPTSMEGVPR